MYSIDKCSLDVLLLYRLSDLLNMEILEKDLKMVPGSGMIIAMSSVTMEMEVGYWSQVSDLVINKQLNLPEHICFYDSAVSIVHRTTSGSSVAHRTLEQGVAG